VVARELRAEGRSRPWSAGAPRLQSVPAGRPVRYDALVLDAQYHQALATMRSLARAGHSVAAAACSSEALEAPSFQSRWCAATSILPEITTDPDGYVDALLELLDAEPVSVVMPAHDGTIDALRARRADIERRTFLPLGSDRALEVATSKPRTLALAAELGIRTPASYEVQGEADLRAALAETGFPAVIKPARSWVVDATGAGSRITSILVADAGEAVAAFDGIAAAGGSAIVQTWLPGSREAVSLFVARGRVWARFAQRSYREWPVLGGTSVLCESIPLLYDITTAAERLVDAMELDGCSMVEFRRDQEGRPVLMEVNPRLGMSVDLAIRCGVDLPGLVYAWATGRPLESVSGYEVGRRRRSLIGELWWVSAAVTSGPNPEMPPPGRAIATALGDFVRRPSRFDVLSLSDPRPGLRELGGFARQYAWPRARRSLGLR
jgi:predicted ATP-grasp superfamily ATP-dependent carboligase